MNASFDINDPILTTREAAGLLGVAVSTVQVWMESGALPAWKTPGGHRRMHRSAVMQLVQQQAALTSSMAPGPARPVQPQSEFAFCPGPGYPIGPLEAQRLNAVRDSGLLYSPQEAVFDRLTWLAAHAAGCPMALLTLLSARRQWFKSRIGMAQRESTRANAFCNHTILHDGLFVVEDARADPRFAANPMVTGEPHIRFYAGYALKDANSLALGSLCVLDREPRRLGQREQRALQELAAIASDEIKRHA